MRGEERGQALAVLVAVLGLVAFALAALAAADARLFAQLRARHAAEAAAEAAGAIVADHLFELHQEALETRRDADHVAAALADAGLRRRAETSARAALRPFDSRLEALRLERRADELSVRAEVRLAGTVGVARVGVRPP